MKTLRIVIAAACLALPACYEFDFPLDPKPVVRVDPRLVGAWRCLGAETSVDDLPATLRIVRRTSEIMHWSFESLSSDGTKDMGEYDVYASTMKGGALLNALELGEKASGKWSFVQYALLLPNVLRIQVVDDKPFEKVRSHASDLRKAIERRRNDPSIYTDYCVCVRVKASSEPSPSSSPSSTPAR